MSNILETSMIPQAATNTLALSDAADQLVRYMRISSRNDIIDAISLSATSNIETNANVSALDDALKRRAARDMLTQVGNYDGVSSAQIQSAIDDLNSSDEMIKISSITPKMFGDLNSERAVLDTKSSKTEIMHYAMNGSNVGINFSDRGSEYTALFCNMIPSVELSACVPYFRLNFIQSFQNSKEVSLPFLSLDSFLGAKREDSNGAYFYGANSVPSSPTSQALNPFTTRAGTKSSGMELFLTPQTVVNTDINQNAIYNATRGIKVLDPLQPLMSIESVAIDVESLSKGFMVTNSKVSLSLILHDRSRLAEISPLISPTLYPAIRVEVETGWSHPDNNPMSNNPYAKFLNALKIRQIYAVSSVSLNSRDSTSLNLKVILTGVGEFTSNNTSIFTGKFISYELLRSKMKQLFTIIDQAGTSTGTEGSTIGTSQTIVGAEPIKIDLSNWDTSDKWIKYEDYLTISQLIDNTLGDQSVADKLIDKYKDIVTNSIIQDSTSINQTSLSEQLRTELSLELSKVDYLTSPYLTSEVLDEKIKSFIKRNILTTLTTDTVSNTLTGDSVPVPIISLGDAIFRLFTVPMSFIDIYDEIRVTTFDFNDYAGNMGGFNIGLFPILVSDINDRIIKQKMTCEAALVSLLQEAKNSDHPAYGIKFAITQKQEAEKAYSNDKSQESVDASSKTREEIQSTYERSLKELYTSKSTALSGLINVSYEPKFVPPDVKCHTEVTSVSDNGVTKLVLNIFIYDGATTGKRSLNLLSSIMQKSSGNVRVFTKSSDIDANVFGSTNMTPFNIVKKDNEMYSVSVTRGQAKSILTAAYPTLRIGAEGTTIINASYASSVSGELQNIKVLEGYKNNISPSQANSFPGVNADLFVIPSSLTITMLGMPLVNRGQIYFVDFGTGTTLDNVYSVTSVKHTIKGGSYVTTVNLVVTFTGTIKSIITDIQNDLDVLQSYTKNL